MDDLCSSLWLYQEDIDEMRQRLRNTLFELEALKMEANEQARKRREEVDKLLNLLKLAQQERDEARDHLAQFLKNPNFPILPTKTNPNSSITESDSFSQSSSPVQSFLDNVVSSPEFSSFVNQQPLIQDSGDGPRARIDPSDALIDDLAKGKALPEMGKLLTAVMEAGPLLQTLLVAGRLPEWINPPPPQRFGLPPVSIRGFDDVMYNSQMSSTSVLKFGPGSVSVFCNQALTGKRQRLE